MTITPATPRPDAARSRLPVRTHAPFIWTTLPEWAELDEPELDALPRDSRRSVEVVPGIYATAIKQADGTWTLMNRQGIRSRALAGARTAPRVPIDPDGVP